MSSSFVRSRLLPALAAAAVLVGISPFAGIATASAAEVSITGTGTEAATSVVEAAEAACTQTLSTADFIRDQATGMAETNNGVWGETASLRIQIRKSVVIQPGCSFDFSLASYETDGADWKTSGNQRFIDHDVITLDATNRIGTLRVDAPSCYGQVDLYHGSTIYDGGDGPGHAPTPRYPDRQIADLIAATGGGTACPVSPSTEISISECVAGQASTATVTVAVSEGTGSSALSVWAKTGTGEYAQVGATTTLPVGSSSGARTASVVVPLVEDVAVTIQVRADGQVVKTYDAITADCVKPVVPSTELTVNACVSGVSTATVALSVSEGSGTSAFTVWAKTGTGSYAQVGGTTTLPAGTVRTANVTVPLVEDVPVTIEVRVGNDVLKTYDAITADCVQKPPPPVSTPSVSVKINDCYKGKSTSTVTLKVTEGTGSNAFTVWSKTGTGSYTQVGGTVTLPAGNSRTGTVTVPLVEDKAVSIQVRVNGTTLETYSNIRADCDCKGGPKNQPDPKPDPKPQPQPQPEPCKDVVQVIKEIKTLLCIFLQDPCEWLKKLFG